MSIIVGVSANYHDAACCLLRDGMLLAAVQEERLTRVKHDPTIPIHALRACLAVAEASVADVNCVAYYEDPALKLGRTGSGPSAHEVLESLRRRFGHEGTIRCFRHHASHAASAFYASGFADAAVLTVDGVGEWATTSYWKADGRGLHLLEEVRYPHSLGLLYSALTHYLGFAVNDGEYKVMGLASYGKPSLLPKLRELVRSESAGQFRLDMRYFDYDRPDRMHSPGLEALLGEPPRQPQERIAEFHADLASSVQVLLEELLLEKVQYLHKRAGSDRLCMAGGVALNCVANGRIHRESPFRHVFVQPAAGDAGGALGAAALAHVELYPGIPLNFRLEHVFLGPSYGVDEVRALLEATAIPYRFFAEDRALSSCVASHLVSGRIVGWFRGRMEFGPRALGARSILADPRVPSMRERINAVVKRRESFRPFAPVVLEDRANALFELPYSSPFMLETCAVRPNACLPSVTHVDGSARVQTVNRASGHPLASLLCEFERLTDCPALLNTSFNMKDEPIVCTPEDAIVCFARSEMDVLVIEGCVIERASTTPRLIETLRRAFVPRAPGITEHVYTLV